MDMQSFRLCTRLLLPVPVIIQTILLITTHVALAQPARLWIETERGRDTLFAGVPATVEFRLSCDSANVAGVAWPLEYRFTNGNIIGPLTDTAEISFSQEAQTVFETRIWNLSLGTQATDPDTTLCLVTSLGPTHWQGSGIIWIMRFTPADTGQITIDSVRPYSATYMDVVDELGQSLPFTWEPKTLHVVTCPIEWLGDVNCDSLVDLSDLVLLGNILDGFTGPDGTCVHCGGDVNLNGIIEQGDYVRLFDMVAGVEP
jgi:hypothetical protein